MKGLTVKIFRSILPVFALVLMVGGTNRFADAAESGKTAPLRVAYSAITVDQAIPWIALDAGHFKKHGLEVELIHASSITRCTLCSPVRSPSPSLSLTA